MEVLAKARELLSNPEHWIKNTLAKDKNNMPVDSKDPNATCWCLIGALENVSKNDDELHNAIFYVSRKLPIEYATIADFNDSKHTEHSNILQVLKEAHNDQN